MSTKLRALIVEDSEQDTLLLARELERAGYDLVYKRVETAEDLTDALAGESWDIIFADYTMPRFRGTHALNLLNKSGLDIPFIFVSGTIGEAAAVEAMLHGAKDYIVKGNLQRLVPAVERELRDALVRRERKRAEEKIRLQTERIWALHEIDKAIMSTLDLPSVLSILLEKVELFLPCPAALSVRLLNKETGLLEPVAVRNMAKEEWIAYMRGIPEPRKSFGSMAMEAKAPIIVRNIQTDPRTQLPEFYRRHGLVSCFFIPLIAKEEPVGTLCIFAKGEHDFTEEEIEFLTTLAGQAAIAIHNSQLYEEMAKLAGDLAKSNRVKDEFLSVMSHELRTPLNVVVGYTGMIKDGLLGAINRQQEEALGKVIARANDQLGMVNNILYATVLETEKVNIDMHEVSVGDFLSNLKAAYEAPINKDFTLEWDYPADLPVVKTDSAKLKLIMQNLIDNAVKFTSKGNVTISARIRHEATGNRQQEEDLLTPHASRLSPTYVEFKVADTGVGIPKDAMPFIFDKFHQVDSSETRLFGGVGMGLYIVKKFTELLGGTVEVESEPGEGAAFTVTIPCH